MKLLLDENLPPAWAKLLQAQFPEHRFVTTAQTHLQGVDDSDLFPAAAQLDIEVIVMNDLKQMERLHERRAVFEAALSWIGIEAGSHVTGTLSLRLQLATRIAGLAVLEGVWRNEPWAYKLRHITATETARLDAFDLWHDSWGPRPARSLRARRGASTSLAYSGSPTGAHEARSARTTACSGHRRV